MFYTGRKGERVNRIDLTRLENADLCDAHIFLCTLYCCVVLHLNATHHSTTQYDKIPHDTTHYT